MPNIKELYSLVDYGQFSPAFPLVHPFTGVKAGHYWSSTTMKGNPDRAFSLYLSFGVAGRSFKTENFVIWPVRDGPQVPGLLGSAGAEGSPGNPPTPSRGALP